MVPALSSNLPADTPLHLQIGMSEPWGYYQPIRLNGKSDLVKIKGIWVDVVHLISIQSGIQFKLSLSPYPRVLLNMARGHADLSFLVTSPTPTKGAIDVAYIFSYASIIVPQKDHHVTSYDHLYGKRIGIARGVIHTPTFDQDGALIKQTFKNYETLISMFSKGRLDLIAGNSISLLYLLKQHHPSNKVGSPFVLAKTPVWLQFSSKSRHLDKISPLKQAIDKLRNAGEFNRILKRYYAPKENFSPPPDSL